jgi:PAS domain S-box-containing protein
MLKTNFALAHLGEIGKSRPGRYALAIVITLAATLAQWMLMRTVGPMPPFLMFYPAVLCVAMAAGVGPGILTIILSALSVDYWGMPPVGSFSILAKADVVAFALFIAMSLALCMLADRLRLSRRIAELAEAKANRLLTTAQADKEWLSLVLSSIREEVYFTDTEGKYTFANPAAMQEFGHTAVVGIDVEKLVRGLVVLRADGTPRPLSEAPPLRALAGEIVRDEEQIVLTPRTGELRNRLVSAAPARDENGKIIGAVSTVRDITAFKRVEASLREADQRKNVFLATLAHELRNPLAPIRTAAQMLGSATLKPQELERCRSIISRQVAHMASLLDDLLDVSRLTRGELALKKSYVSLRHLLDAAIETAQPLITAKKHQLIVEATDSTMLEVDSVRFTQVISNLLTNAAKYTKPGGVINLICAITDDSLVISVRDNGIGLPAELHGKIFEIFVQVDTAAEGGEGGLGIGLALAKVLVEMHGGQIEVASAGRGHGSTFTVSVPGSVVQPPQAGARDNGDAVGATHSRCVLIADDNVDAAESLQMLLQASGHQVHIARDGIEALELATKLKPDVAVLDIGMPGLSGIDVAIRIRGEAWGTGTTLIALTGWGQDDDKRKTQAAGFDYHMTKPADPDKLESIVLSGRGEV